MHTKYLHTTYVVAAILCLLIAGCIPTSTHPITKITDSEIDESILGVWEADDEKHKSYMHIGRGKAKNMLVFEAVTFAEEGPARLEEYTGFVSTVNNNRYLNIYFSSDNGDTTYYFVKYYLKDDKFFMSEIDNEFIRNAIADKSLKGEITKSDVSDTVLITAEPEQLRKFIVEHDNMLFTDFNSMTRIAPQYMSFKPGGGKGAAPR